jgi:hypothetical protein
MSAEPAELVLADIPFCTALAECVAYLLVLCCLFDRRAPGVPLPRFLFFSAFR